MLKTPLSQRGALWNFQDNAVSLFLQFPLFIVSYKEDRKTLYAKLQEINGNISPFVGGVLIHPYDDVVKLMESKKQPRGPFLSNRVVSEQCLSHNLMIFQSNGPEHKRMRNHFWNVPGLNRGHAGFDNPLVVGDEKDGGGDVVPSETTVKRAVLRNVWTRFWGERPSADVMAAGMEYTKVAGSCILGEGFYKLFGEKIKTSVYRAQLTLAAKATEVAKIISEKAVTELGKKDGAEVEVVEDTADAFLFAALLGTTHLTTKTLDRIKTDPQRYVPLWKRNPVLVCEILNRESWVRQSWTGVCMYYQAS